MSIKISDLLQQNDLCEGVEVIRDYAFDTFARATTIVDGKKCVFVADKKYSHRLDASVSMVITTIAGLLTGNANILCIPYKDFEQVGIISDAINTVLKEHEVSSLI